VNELTAIDRTRRAPAVTDGLDPMPSRRLGTSTSGNDVHDRDRPPTWTAAGLRSRRAAEGPAGVILERIEDGGAVVVTGEGTAHHREEGRTPFAYIDLFTFRGGSIAELDSYVVPLTAEP
jgi:hypothetical protein